MKPVAMAGGFVGVLISDAWLQNQFTQVKLRSLKSQFLTIRDRDGYGGGPLKVRDLAAEMSGLKIVGDALTETDRTALLRHSHPDLDAAVDFELFLQVYLKMQGQAGVESLPSLAFLKAATTTLLHTISESEKSSYVAHINSYLGEDAFLKPYLPMDPLSDDLFQIVKDGVLLCKLINVAAPIDEREINTKRVLNPWERNENHTLCLNSAKAIGCTVVNISTQDIAEGRVST